MSPAELIPSAQAEILEREIAQQTREECGAVTAAAEQEARAIVADAHATARRRMHEAVVELRREAARRIARAEAAAETAARQRAQRRAATAVERAWPLLTDAVAARWHNEAGRRAWTAGVVRAVRDRIAAPTLAVEHPLDWTAAEQRDFCSALGREAGTVTFTPRQDLAAGIRVNAARATLDATPHGLLADRQAIAALLLAEIDRPGGPTTTEAPAP
jgi:hypothetical protein